MSSNSNIRFPRRSSHLSTNGARSDANFNYRPERSKQSALRREAGVHIVATEMQNSPAAQEANARPRRTRPADKSPMPKDAYREHENKDHAGNPSPLSSQLPQEAHDLLSALDPDDPRFLARRRGIISRYTQVWEEIPATPLIIDFSNVLEPRYPQRLHPADKYSKHPQRALYSAAKEEAWQLYPQKTRAARQSREEWYWQQMDQNLLPADFNPYPPGGARHDAFNSRTILVDDRVSKPNGQNPSLPVLQTKDQIQKRARRKAEKGIRLTDEEFELLFDKPVEEWDIEELSRGYPKSHNGKFMGRPPGKYMQAAVREKIDTLFKQKVRGSMNETTVNALQVLSELIRNDDTDFKGKPLVAASTKVDAAKFLIEHLLGKPKQTVENDIGAKLQGILAGVMVSPEMALPTPGSNEPVSPTGRYHAGQRGQRQDFVDEELLALERAGIIDAEIVETEEDDT